MTKYFRVVNFDHYQHYKDRMPPWIKFYNSTLESYSFSRLQDASKWHAVAILLLASRKQNILPYDEKWLTEAIHSTDQVKLQPLLDIKFIEIVEDCNHIDSIVLADDKQDAIPEKNRTNKEEEKDKKKMFVAVRDGQLPENTDFENFKNERFNTSNSKVAWMFKSSHINVFEVMLAKKKDTKKRDHHTLIDEFAYSICFGFLKETLFKEGIEEAIKRVLQTFDDGSKWTEPKGFKKMTAKRAYKLAFD